jgi:hypothetical protein
MNSVLKVQEAWRKAASELGIQFVCPFSLRNGCDTVQFHGMVPGFGSPKGTVFIASVTFEEDVSAASRLAGECGYFFSIISAAGYANFDRSSFLETLKDWGLQNMEIVPPQGFARPIKTKKKAPNQSLETTTLAVTPAASHPSRQPRSRLT